MDSHAYPGARDYLETEVAGRARHATSEEVRTTCSLARAERLIGQEYHGRFLIELLQNAADTSRNMDGRPGRSRLLVRISEGPALLVANQGEPMSAEVVIKSLGHIGASTKAQGQAIGHKGIGFKSVLELTLRPEIYSGLRGLGPALAVGFDRERALKKIRAESDGWDEWVVDAQGPDHANPFAAVPVLRFPHWIDPLPAEVAELASDGFDTVVRLPFDGHPGDADTWVETVRKALEDVSDRILLLLGSFEEVRIEDRPAEAWGVEVISPEWEQEATPVEPGVSRETVRVLRNGLLSSRWRLYRGGLPDKVDLSGEIAVGVRVDDRPDAQTVLSAAGDSPAAPFHLFFPTRISSGLPFLLHAYFEVNAARTAFYDGSEPRNRAMMDALAELASIAVADAIQDENLSLASLVNLVAEAGEPEVPLAREFRTSVLDRLDGVAWIPLEEDERRGERPEQVFSADRDLIRRIGDAFPAAYVRSQTGLGLPDDGLTPPALALIEERREKREKPVDIWEQVGSLCRPGKNRPWEGDEGKHFLCLIELFAALDGRDHEKTEGLLTRLRGNSESRLVPTVGGGSTRVLLPIPNPEEAIPGQRSQLVMARVRTHDGGGQLVPPPALDVAFLPDGLLSSEAELARARPLGIRPFTVINVLERLKGTGSARNVDHEGLVRFLWQLLGRARRAANFDPSEGFWCKPGHGRDEASRSRQQREQNLSEVRLPCKDDSWQSAGRVAFGNDWADWLEERADGRPSAATRDRIAAYRAMERLSPGPEHLLAHPGKVLALLDADIFERPISADSPEEVGEELDEEERNAYMHGFLLRLGVWEVPPIEAYVNWGVQNRGRFPWPGETAERQREAIEQNGGWKFGYGWTDRPHQNVYVAEDFRFLWSLEVMAGRDMPALVTGLRLGQRLYSQSSVALALCPGCGGRAHTAWRYSGVDDGFPSSLVIQLSNAEWVPCTVNGESPAVSVNPKSAWWHRRPPAGSALNQSPWRLVPLCSPDTGLTEELRRLSGISTMEDAGVDAVKALLVKLRRQFEGGELAVDPMVSGSARQAFVGLHRLAYERLSEHSTVQAVDAAVLEGDDDVGVLCELGEDLVYRKPGEARHDDGRFATYTRHFVGDVPFAAVARDRGPTAKRLGIPEFRLRLSRRDKGEGQDVTDDVRDMHLDRIAELMAIVVHHSLGGQTLDETSGEFDTRARRLRNLRIKQLKDLVVQVEVVGLDAPRTLGEGSGQDLFLEGPTSSSPVLFHDLSEENWRDRLRYKIAPYLATLVENPAYAHTFALFLQRENEAEREDFLMELGISAQEVDAIATRLGVVREEERRRHLRWFAAILQARGAEARASDLDLESVPARLKSSGLPANVVDRLVTLGGGGEVRRETGNNSALRLLSEAKTDLKGLHQRLTDMRDPGLSIKDAHNAFYGWLNPNRGRLAAVLATKLAPDDAKRKAASLKPPAELGLVIDPAMSRVLEPVVRALRDAGIPEERLTEKTVDRLAHSPKEELARLGGFTTSELGVTTRQLYNSEETRKVLKDLADRWREEIKLLAILAGTGASATRNSIRQIRDEVERKLPSSPPAPTKLRDATAELFAAHAELSRRVQERLVDSLDAAPDQDQLLQWAREDGVAVGRLPVVREALDRSRANRVRDLRDRSEQLTKLNRRPAIPEMLKRDGANDDRATGKGRPQAKEEGGDGADGGKVSVRPIKVGKGHDAHKRKLGDEGERWALASVVGDLMGIGGEERNAALDEIVALLSSRFRDEAVEMALSHETTARRPDLDKEELFDALSGLLHVSRYSDLFGFDLIGWVPSGAHGGGRAVCMEVKSSGGGGFHLSRHEWSTAERFHSGGAGDQYAVLVVLRSKGGGVPAALHLLSDPVSLKKSGRLQMQADGYQVVY